MGSGSEVQVQISGDSSGLTSAVDDAVAGLGSLKSTALAAGGALAVGLASKGIMEAVGAARELNEQIRELTKVTNATTAAHLTQQMQALSERVPLATTELTKIATAAARFGVGSDHVAQFTETVSKMAFATNLSVNEAGQAFARLSKLTNTPINQIENLGSAINKLGQTTATSTADIVDGMLRSSAALSQLGVSNRNIVALQASLNAVSESSRRAGTRLRRVAQEMLNPKKTSDLAAALGMTADQFRSMRQNDPTGLLMKMVKRMAEGGEAADGLRKTLSTASRQALAGLAQNLDGTREALATSTTAFEKATSLQREFRIESDSLGSNIQRLKNRLFNLGAGIGNQLIPYLKVAVKWTTGVVDAFASLNKATSGLAGPIALLGSLLAGGSALVGALASIVPAAGAASGALAGLEAALAVLTGPIGAVVAAVAGLYLAYKTNFLGIRDVVDGTIGKLQRVFDRNLGPMLDKSRRLATRLRRELAPAIRIIKSVADTVLPPLAKLFRAVFDAISDVVVTAVDTALSVINAGLSLLLGDTDGALEILGGLFDRRFAWIVRTIKGAIDSAIAWVSSIGLDDFYSAFHAIGDAIRTVILTYFRVNGLLVKIVSKWASHLAAYIGSGGAYRDISAAFDALAGAAQAAIAGFASWVVPRLKSMIAAVATYVKTQAYHDVVAAFEALIGAIMDSFRGLYDGLIGHSLIPEMFQAISTYVKNAGKNLIAGAFRAVTSGIEGALNNIDISGVSSALNGLIDKAEKAIHKVSKAANSGGGPPSTAGVTYGGVPTDVLDNGGSSLPSGIGQNPFSASFLASGGIVTQPTLAMIGEGGSSEAVIPLDQLDQVTGPSIGTVVVQADSRRGGREAANAFVDELRSHGFRQ